MPDYWFDTNVFIEPKNRYYSFELAPRYWSFLVEKGGERVVSSPRLVYDELTADKDDDLARWARDNRDCGLFVQADEQVQAEFERVAAYVVRTYEEQAAALFLAGADPWLIAHALANGGRVVTFETRKNPPKVGRIPNICDEFGVECEDLFVALKALGLTMT